MGFLGVYKALYDYTSQNDQELALSEGDLLLVLEKSTEDEWWKAKKKTPAGEGEEPVGLVPNNYIEEAAPIHRAKALYDYARQTDEELSLVEDAEIAVYDTSDPDWTLVGSGREYGFAPANYIELLETAAPTSPATRPVPRSPEYKTEPVDSPVPEPPPDPGQGPAAALAGIIQGKTPTLASATSPSSPPVQERFHRAIYTPDASDEEPPATLAPSLPMRPSSQQISSPPPVISPRSPQSPSPAVSPRENKPTWRDHRDHIPKSPGRYHLYNISEMVSVMGKRKKMPTTLGLNTVTGTIMIAPEKSRDGPQQEWTGDKLMHYSIEGKHIFMELVRPSKSVDFHAGAKDTAEEIVSGLGEIAGAFRAEGLKEVLAAGSGTGQGRKRGHVLYDFVAQGDDEVTVDVGDLVDILDDTRSEEWWMVRRVKNGAQGVMPSSYVEVIKDASPLSRSTATPDLYRSTAERNRLEEERLTKQAVKSQQVINGSQSPPAEVGLGVKLPKRGSSLMSKDNREIPAAQARRRESKTDTKSPPTTKSKPDRSKVRTWTDRSGSFKVEAEFIGCTEGKIHLHKLNGVKIAVPVIKMSVEDLEYVEKITGMSLDEDKPLSDIKRRSQSGSVQAAPKVNAPIAAAATSEPPVQKSEKDETDWFDFFLKCGVPANLCVRYATSFSKDSMDESVLPDVGPDVLRTLGLKEGDILKVMKYLDNLYGRTGANRVKRNVSFGGTEVIGKDQGNSEVKAGPDSERTGGLFAGRGGALRNNTRKGRPAPAVQTKDVVDAKVFERNAGGESKLATSSQTNVSPETAAPPPVKKDTIGFDDDAWSVKPTREQRSTSQASTVPSAGAGANQPSQPVLTDTMKELSLLSPPLQPTVTHNTGAQQSVQSQPTTLPSAIPSSSIGTSGGNQSGLAQPSQNQTAQQPPQRDNTQQFGLGPGNLQSNMPPRQRPLAPSQQAITNPAQFILPPPPRPLSAPQNNSQQSGFAPPPLQPQLTGYQNPSNIQSRIAPPGQSLNEIQQTMFQPFSQPSQQSQPNTFVPSSQMMVPPNTAAITGLIPRNTGFVSQQQNPLGGFPPSQPYLNGQMQGFGIVNPQQTGMVPPLASQMTGAHPPFMTAPTQQPIRTGSINSFLPPALQPQPTGPGGFGQGFHTLNPPPVPSIPQQIPAAPLQPQKTGPAPSVRFGLAPETKRIVPQPTGRRANLAQATPENPFGF